MKLNSVVAAVACVAFTTSPVLASGGPPLETVSYSSARIKLMEAGFKPFVMPGGGECNSGSEMCYPEVESCVHKRHWVCVYNWKSGTSIFHLETRAQDNEAPLVDSFLCILNCGKDADVTAMAQAAAVQKP